jgi:putative oxidoreductase
MSTTGTRLPAQGRGMLAFVWVYRIVVAMMFLAAAGMKLTGQPMMVAEFQQVGLGQWFRYFTGGLELIGAVLVLLPRFTPLGALLLLLVDIGAFIAQVTVLHMGWIHTIVTGLILAGLIWVERDKLAQR